MIFENCNNSLSGFPDRKTFLVAMLFAAWCLLQFVSSMACGQKALAQLPSPANALEQAALSTLRSAVRNSSAVETGTAEIEFHALVKGPLPSPKKIRSK